MEQLFVAFTKDESGQDLIEYARVTGLIGLGAVVAMTSLSGKLGNSFNSVGNNLQRHQLAQVDYLAAEPQTRIGDSTRKRAALQRASISQWPHSQQIR